MTHIFSPTFCFCVTGDIDALNVLDALDDAVEDGNGPHDEDYIEGDESNSEEENINEKVEVLDTADSGKKKDPSVWQKQKQKRKKSHIQC